MVMLYRMHLLPGEAASPGAGRAVYPTMLEVSSICLLVCCHWQDWLACKLSSSPPQTVHRHEHLLGSEKEAESDGQRGHAASRGCLRRGSLPLCWRPC